MGIRRENQKGVFWLRVQLQSRLDPGSSCLAKILYWHQYDKELYATGTEITVHDNHETWEEVIDEETHKRKNGVNFGLEGEVFNARYHADTGRFEIIGSRGLERVGKVTSLGTESDDDDESQYKISAEVWHSPDEAGCAGEASGVEITACKQPDDNLEVGQLVRLRYMTDFKIWFAFPLIPSNDCTTAIIDWDNFSYTTTKAKKYSVLMGSNISSSYLDHENASYQVKGYRRVDSVDYPNLIDAEEFKKYGYWILMEDAEQEDPPVDPDTGETNWTFAKVCQGWTKPRFVRLNNSVNATNVNLIHNGQAWGPKKSSTDPGSLWRGYPGFRIVSTPIEYNEGTEEEPSYRWGCWVIAANDQVYYTGICTEEITAFDEATREPGKGKTDIYLRNVNVSPEVMVLIASDVETFNNGVRVPLNSEIGISVDADGDWWVTVEACSGTSSTSTSSS